ncbi:thioredoxin family protein [Paenibacillus sp. MMS20-IR301]|uniref:thioredoxin family protein n=1 Tax=Paenibacillus sp. MMS20-IR301 TaxID=2895946 RepID=UPI0028E52716|nr:thioredoxin family protein [Paenibacillus sp. MMS20-IR301]WNS41702.1 thioredoxin family protein [Paenibacillus sp. MMS20-IR301]
MAIIIAEDAVSVREQLQAEGTVLVDYGASWCPPCRTLLPILEELNVEYGEAVKMIKVDCDELPELASEAGVMSMPTVIVYSGGQAVEKLVGLRPKSVYQGVLNKTAGLLRNTI